MSQLDNKIVLFSTSDYRECINKNNRSLMSINIK